MKVIGSFQEVEIIEIDDKQIIRIYPTDSYKKNLKKHGTYKVFVTVNQIKEIYEYLRRKGLC